jgi:hypothetical protein
MDGIRIFGLKSLNLTHDLRANIVIKEVFYDTNSLRSYGVVPAFNIFIFEVPSPCCRGQIQETSKSNAQRVQAHKSLLQAFRTNPNLSDAHYPRQLTLRRIDARAKRVMLAAFFG